MLACLLGSPASTAPWGWWSPLDSTQGFPLHLACSQILCRSRTVQYRWHLQRGVNFSWGSQFHFTLKQEDARTWIILFFCLYLGYDFSMAVSFHKVTVLWQGVDVDYYRNDRMMFWFCRRETKFKTKLPFHRTNKWVKSWHSPKFNTEANTGRSEL